MRDSHDKAIAVFIISLLRMKGVGPKTVGSFLDYERARIESSSRLDANFIESLGPSASSKAGAIVRALRKSEMTWEELEAAAFDTLELAEERGIHVLHPFMSSYPRRLIRNQAHPPILYCRGALESLDSDKAVAIVGTRHPTEFGCRMARRLAQVLSEDGYVVISGLAVGSDTAGHSGALDAGGRTVAVLPTPVDSAVYPRQNQELANRILENGGALVSEYTPGVGLNDRQLISNLVARDEWQPALSDGIVAVETSVDGGTRHAMEHALRTGVPAAVFDYSSREHVDFYNDPRFGGNVEYLKMLDKVSPIFGPHTIEVFKARMDEYRSRGDADGAALPQTLEDTPRLFE